VFIRLTPGEDPAPRRRELGTMFSGVRADLVAHNAQFETEVLLAHGVEADLDCTLLMAKALYLHAVREDLPQPQGFSLAALVEKEFGRNRDKSIRDRDWRQEESLDEAAIEYGLQDARDVIELHRLYRARLEEEELLAGYEIIRQALLPTAAINLAGLTFDGTAHERLMVAMQAEADRLEQELDAICGGQVENHGSTTRISCWIIREVLGDDDEEERLARFCARLQARTGSGWKHTKNGQLAITKSTKRRKAEALAEHFPTVSAYLLKHLQWNRARKLLDAFGAPLRKYVDADGRVRGQLKVGGTVTLRHTAEQPNVQQMPREKEFRALFKAAPGRRLAVCDFSQLELRLAAIVAHDEALLAVYREGRDVHAEVAAAIGMPRGAQSKGVSFAMIYGAGVAGVAEAAGLTIERATEVVESFLGAYPGLAAYRERAPVEAEASGYIAIRPGRRILYDPTLSSGPQAINFAIQGAAASVQMGALRRVWETLQARPELDARLVGAVHDELLLEAPEGRSAETAADFLQTAMREALLAIFPEAEEQGAATLAAATVCGSWAEKP
jgi:DNA polymerase I